MILVAILTVRREFLEEYRAYKRLAAAIMADHAVRIERTVAVNPEGNSEFFREAHLARFPGFDALNAYEADPDLLALSQVRNRVVLGTEILIGADGPEYGGGPV